MNYKNLLDWRLHLFFKKIFFVLFFSIFVLLFANSEEKKDIYAIVSKIIAKESKPEVFVENESAELIENDIITSNITIITKEQQKIELVFYQKDQIHSYILIQENTDLTFTLDQINSAIRIYVKYGAVRISLKKGMKLEYFTETVKALVDSAEFGVISKIDINNKRAGYFIVFNGKIRISPVDVDLPVFLERFNIANFVDNNISLIKKLDKLTFDLWKKNGIFTDKKIISDNDVYLEKLNFLDTQNILSEKIAIEEENKEETLQEEKIEEQKRMKNVMIDKDKILSGFISFKLSAVVFNNDIGIMGAFDPLIDLDGFKIGFYFPIYFVPYKAVTGNWMMKVNDDNNEWSFGTDQTGVNKIIFDIFDDFLLKINKISYYSEYDILTSLKVEYGDVFEISDLLSYSLFKFGLPIFYSAYRNSSFLFNAKIPWFEVFVYAENLLPKGLYCTEFTFMTPYSSNRLRVKFGIFSDFYYSIRFDNDESYFPLQGNFTINFEPFNVNFMRFTLYLNSGILIPFSINMYENSSLFLSMVKNNPYLVASNISGSTGFLYRILNFTVQGEFIVDSGINKTGLFDTYYMYKRRYYNYIFNWFEKMEEDGTVLKEYAFGFRTILSLKLKKYFSFSLAYKATFPFYYDKISFHINFDTGIDEKAGFSLFTYFVVEKLIEAVLQFSKFRENSILSFGFIATPVCGVNISTTIAMLPYIYLSGDPWYTKMMAEIAVSIKPYKIYFKNKDREIKENDRE